eukprot:6231922-Prymnesium_polylepis.1
MSLSIVSCVIPCRPISERLAQLKCWQGGEAHIVSKCPTGIQSGLTIKKSGARGAVRFLNAFWGSCPHFLTILSTMQDIPTPPPPHCPHRPTAEAEPHSRSASVIHTTYTSLGPTASGCAAGVCTSRSTHAPASSPPYSSMRKTVLVSSPSIA